MFDRLLFVTFLYPCAVWLYCYSGIDKDKGTTFTLIHLRLPYPLPLYPLIGNGIRPHCGLIDYCSFLFYTFQNRTQPQSMWSLGPFHTIQYTNEFLLAIAPLLTNNNTTYVTILLVLELYCNVCSTYLVANVTYLWIAGYLYFVILGALTFISYTTLIIWHYVNIPHSV